MFGFLATNQLIKKIKKNKTSIVFTTANSFLFGNFALIHKPMISIKILSCPTTVIGKNTNTINSIAQINFRVGLNLFKNRGLSSNGVLNV